MRNIRLSLTPFPNNIDIALIQNNARIAADIAVELSHRLVEANFSAAAKELRSNDNECEPASPKSSGRGPAPNKVPVRS